MSISLEQLNTEKKTGLDCRETKPTSVRPDCSFMTCQIGKFSANRAGDTVFHLYAAARTWDRAMEVLKFRADNRK